MRQRLLDFRIFNYLNPNPHRQHRPKNGQYQRPEPLRPPHHFRRKKIAKFAGAEHLEAVGKDDGKDQTGIYRQGRFVRQLPIVHLRDAEERPERNGERIEGIDGEALRKCAQQAAVVGYYPLFSQVHRFAEPGDDGHHEQDRATRRTDHFGQVNAVRNRIQPSEAEVRCRRQAHITDPNTNRTGKGRQRTAPQAELQEQHEQRPDEQGKHKAGLNTLQEIT